MELKEFSSWCCLEKAIPVGGKGDNYKCSKCGKLCEVIEVLPATEEDTKLEKIEEFANTYFPILYGIYSGITRHVDSVSNTLRSFRYRFRHHVWRHQVYNLDGSIVKFVLPRLKLLRKNANGFPAMLTEKKWDEILDDIIWSLDHYYFSSTKEWGALNENKKKQYEKKYIKGLDLFGKWWYSFWD